jgi:hypothetical protein
VAIEYPFPVPREVVRLNLYNSYVYMIFHPLAFIVKLRIELFMAKLIRKLAMEGLRNVVPSFLNIPDLEPGIVHNDGVPTIAVGSFTGNGVEGVETSRSRRSSFFRTPRPSFSESLLSYIVEGRRCSRISSRSTTLDGVENYLLRRPEVEKYAHDSGHGSSGCELEMVDVDVDRRDIDMVDGQVPRTPPEALLHDEISEH